MVVCDDGSTDNSCEVIASYTKQDSRLRLLSKQNGGIASTLNAAYAVCSGEIICILDADDVYLPGKLSEVLGAFRRFPRSGACFHRILKMRQDGSAFGYAGPVVFSEGWVAPQALRGGGRVRTLPTASALSLRRAVADLFFPVPMELRRAVDSYLAYGAQFVTEVCALRSTLARLRVHGRNVSGLGEFTEASVRRYLADLKSVVQYLREFLRRHYGDEVANALRYEDNGQYWRFLLALYVLAGERAKMAGEEPLKAIIAHIEPYQQRALAHLLMALPPILARRALQCWTGQTPGQTTFMRAARSLLRV